jgi:hypothetical protein
MIDTILTFTEYLMRGPLAKVIYIFGYFGTIVMIFWVPIRIVWILISLSIRCKRNEEDYDIVANLLLLLSIIPFIEFIITTGNGISGLFLIALSPIPFILYITSEVVRLIRLINHNINSQ